jgi:uncharacterized protein (DUF433 family)
LTAETGLPEGQEVSVEILPIIANPAQLRPPSPWWLAHLEINPAVRPGKFVIKDTNLLVDELVAHLEEGWTEAHLFQVHPALTPQDVDAAREYAKVTVEMRRCFGAWAEDAEELAKFLEWNRQQRRGVLS